jgi:ElaB/YqjD/DUF883 family membrane-anchored ribosome-binding protein
MTDELGGFQSEQVTKERLVQDLKAVVHDAEELLKSTASDLSERAKEARVRLTAALESAKGSLGNIEEKALQGARATDRIIREHPYPALGIAFGVGLLIGVLVNRK